MSARPERPQRRLGPTPDRGAFELTPDLLIGEFEVATVDHRASFDIGDTTVLFLPVRLETRFFGRELRVRIYPDQVHLNAHQELLTRGEMALGETYWRQRLRGDAEGARAAMVQRIPPRRAVWVAAQTRPTGRDGNGPVFPKLETRKGARPGRAELLPERWAIAGFVDNQRRFVAFGNRIAGPLAFAPDLQRVGSAAAPALADDPMAWMVDYDKALETGMAVTIPLAGFDYGAGGLTLLAVGIGKEPGAEQALERLLGAHHYTDGLAVVAQGTPTNNTDEAIAGWTAEVDDVAGLFAREVDRQSLADPKASAAGKLIDALGLEEGSVLRRVADAGSDEDVAMAAMNRALWPVTWGRYLDDLLAPEDGPSIVPSAKRNTIREFFVDFVRGGAQLPTLSIGAQPYGLLPVMRRDGGDFASDDPLVAVEAILLELRARWRESLPGVARLDPVSGGTSDEAAAEILGSLPHPQRFIVRRLYWQWSWRTGVWKGFWDHISTSDSPLVNLAVAKLWSFQTVQSIEDELEWLQDLIDDPPVADKDVEDAQGLLNGFKSMCEAHLARQEPVQTWYPDAVSGVLDETVTTDPKIFFSGYGNAHEDELFNYPLARSNHASAAQYLASLRERVPTLRPGTTVNPSIEIERWTPAQLRRTRITRSASRDKKTGPIVVDTSRPLPEAFFASRPLLYQLLDPVVEGIGAPDGERYRAALTTLAQRDEGELELRLRETLGLASYRLDAWITAFASRALESDRGKDKRSFVIGGFGWVEGLRPDAAGVRESEGFIHAPSIGHAATAAVLRAGHHAHGSDDPGSLFAVDLRSERMRTAGWLLDGIRQGQALGDLLGCRFERQLHEAEIDHFIDDCRRRVLESKGITRQPRGPVDGLALAELYGASGVRIELPEQDPFTVRRAPVETVPQRRRLQVALDDILASMDSVADASIADSVHHVLQGNTTRASATLDAVATGAVPPPELRGLDTQYGGTSISHRVLLTLRPDTGAAPAWGQSPRTLLEPALAAWAASMLGDPTKIRCTVHIEDLGTTLEVGLADLVDGQGISALDAVMERLALWEARVRAFVLGQGPYAAFEDGLAVDLAPELSEGEISFADAATLTAAMAALIGGARAMDATDLAMPGADAVAGVDLAGAESRLATFRDQLATALADIETLLPEPTEEKPHPVGAAALAALRSALQTLVGYGCGSPPTRGYGEAGRARLHEEAWAARDAAAARLAAHAALAATATLQQRAGALLGKGFPLLPSFVTGPPAAAVLDRTGRLLPDGSAAALAWLGDMARVRLPLHRLDEVLTIGELLRDATPVMPRVGQLPWVDGEPWVATGAPLDRRQAKLALLVLDHGGADRLAAGGPAAGLVVDEWSELIPAEETVTGIAVNYDAPTSRAPQALLLALPPAGRRWSFDRVVDTLLDTLEVAKLRAVDPDVLLAYGHQAPAIFPPVDIASGPQEPSDG